jgi:hypothetical protein
MRNAIKIAIYQKLTVSILIRNQQVGGSSPLAGTRIIVRNVPAVFLTVKYFSTKEKQDKGHEAPC